MMRGLRAIAIDAEFTSWDMIGGDIIALGAVEIFEDYTLGREIELHFKPDSEKYFTEEARKIHQISWWKAQTFPDREKSCVDFLEWLSVRSNQYPIPVALFGTWDFDKKWIESTFDKANMKAEYNKVLRNGLVINVYRLAKDNLKHAELKGHGLKEVARHYKIDLRHHNALSDARATAQIYCNIKKGIDTWTGRII